MSLGIPDEVRELVQTSIASVRQLDLLLLMRQSGETRAWPATELETALRSSATAVDADLAGLLQAALIEVVIGPPTLWRYAPARHGRTVDALAGCYRTHRTAIIGLIAMPSSSGSSTDTIADARRTRRPDPDDD